MSERVFRVGIAGYGRSGCDIHGRWLKQVPHQYRVVGVADQMKERREDAVRDFGCAVFADYRDLIKNVEMELFVNALPSYLHVRGSLDALRAGCHVGCEKPLAKTVSEFDRVVETARKKRRVFAPFQNSRFDPAFAKVREVIASGVLGEIIHIRMVTSSFARRWDWQTLQKLFGGNLVNTGPHPLDQALVLFGPRKPKVFSVLKSIQPCGGDADDFALVTLYGKNAPVVEVVISSYLAYPAGSRYMVNGVYGGLAGDSEKLEWRYYDPTTAPQHPKPQPGVWSDQRRYCQEKLEWKTETWTRPAGPVTGFDINSKGFYDNLYEVLAHGAELVVKPAEVRRQIAVFEECRRQNPLPRRIR
ncbi:MAG: Gfo/Idh/MocA family oxidoreductase [Kiritimatiellae bacterium]|nr:Gfo/Idh/MocA family oxidoreductase [Kiritimatiellia bacterium]